MRLKWIALALLVAAGFAACQAESRAGLKQRLLLRALVAETAPHGQLSYGETVAHFWGTGRIEELRFVPNAETAEVLGWPAGEALELPRLSYTDWQDGPVWPARAALHFEAVRAPLPEPWPQQASGTLDWDYAVDSGELRLGLALDAAGAATLQSQLALKLATPQRLRGAVLLGGSLLYQDAGLAQEQRIALGLPLGADPQNASNALAGALAQWLAARGLPLPPAQRLVLDAFAREPLALRLKLDPPGALRPETLGQFAPADRSAALGLTLELP